MALLTRTGLRINRYCSMADFPFFKMAAVRHLGFLKVGNLTADPIRRPNMRHRSKFCEDRSNHARDKANSSIFKMAAVRHLEFLKLGNFNSLIWRYCLGNRNSFWLVKTTPQIMQVHVWYIQELFNLCYTNVFIIITFICIVKIFSLKKFIKTLSWIKFCRIVGILM